MKKSARPWSFPAGLTRLGRNHPRLIRAAGLRWLAAGLIPLAPLAALNPGVPADGYSIRGWFTEDNLPSNKIRALAQARDGYLWLATAQGIARFDGSQFTCFTGTTHPELRGGGFFAVVEAPDGALWFGGDNGLFRWQHGRFTRFTTKEGLAHNYVRALALTRDGAVVACTRAGYSVMRAGRLSTPGGIWKQVTGIARAYLERADGSILLGTDEGLWRIQGDTTERLSGEPGLGGNGFVSLLETAGAAWIGFSGGLHCLRADGRSESFGAAEGLGRSRVTALQPDQDGNLWVASSDGLFRLARGRIEPAKYPSHFGGATIQQICEDREGALWLATAVGLFRLKDKVSSLIDAAAGLAQTSVYAVREARDGAWWIGVWNGGVYRYEGSRATRLAATGTPTPDQIFALAEASDGALWIGANSGLYRQAAGGDLTNLYQREKAAAWQKQITERSDALMPGIAHNRVNALAVDGESLWAATDGALYHGTAGQFRAYTTADGLPGNTVKSVLRATNGDIWATVPPQGVVRRHEGHWQVYRCGGPLSAIYPRAVYEDSRGAIWITTEGGGINRFKDGHWRTFTTQDGLAHDFISGLVEDSRQNFWIACPLGIMRIPRQEFDELDAGTRALLLPRMFNTFDGLPRGEVNQQGAPNASRTRDGRLLFATDRGVAVIDPGMIRTNARHPPAYVERVVVNGADVDLARPVSIAPGRSDLQIQYTAISLLAPEKVRFRVRLEPLDHEWTDVGARRDVRYAKLPAGEYTFHVIACNNDGVWNETGATLAFTVRPHYYQTPWFIGLVVFAAATAGLGIHRRRAGHAVRQMAILSGLVAERTRELQAAKERAEAAVLARNESIAALGRSQEEVAAERARFKFIFESVPVGTAFVRPDQDGTLLVNPAHDRITGLSPAEALLPGAFDRVTHPDDLVRQRPLTRRFQAGEIDHFTIEKRYLHPGGKIVWAMLTRRMLTDSATGDRQAITTLVDITERKAAEARLAETHKQLLDASRRAGMAEVATDVLHNVGNVLNSVNVSATLAAAQVRDSKALNLPKITAMLETHRGDLGSFLTLDPKGRRIPEYLVILAGELAAERATVCAELDQLQKNIGHIKEIVAMQQSYAKVSGVTETVAIEELVEDALQMHASALAAGALDVVRQYQPGPPITTEPHKVVQILVNLVRNAKDACDAVDRADKRMTVGITQAEASVRVTIRDNGVGIPPENLTRIFAHGFTTRRDGHGFGLHSGALAAKELGGTLTAQSDGPGQGAVFALELPSHP